MRGFGTRAGQFRRKYCQSNGVRQLNALLSVRAKLSVRDVKSLLAQVAAPIFICLFLLFSQYLTNYILSGTDPHPTQSTLPRVRSEIFVIIFFFFFFFLRSLNFVRIFCFDMFWLLTGCSMQSGTWS